MGDIGSNHFIGFRDQLLELGMENLITGCYCDYLFKSLALDKTTSRFLRRESLGPFKMESYLPHFGFATPLAARVRDRLSATFPTELQHLSTERDRLEVAARRVFPLQYEGDNLERTTAHRVLGWMPPSIDNDVIGVFRRVPAEARLNKSLFTRAVLEACPARICRIPDANTTFHVGAPWPLTVFGRYRIALRRSLERRRARIESDESWPNWSYYLTHSKAIAALWERQPAASDAFFREALGPAYRPRLEDYQQDHGLFAGSVLGLRLLTLKTWFRVALAQ
jgi:asparagine synthase (glutamine-hydrolysing)